MRIVKEILWISYPTQSIIWRAVPSISMAIICIGYCRIYSLNFNIYVVSVLKFNYRIFKIILEYIFSSAL